MSTSNFNILLHFSALGLPKPRGSLTKADCYLECSTLKDGVLLRTEVLSNKSKPRWNTPLALPASFIAANPTLQVAILHCRSEASIHDRTRQTLLGKTELALAEVVASKDQTYRTNLQLETPGEASLSVISEFVHATTAAVSFVPVLGGASRIILDRIVSPVGNVTHGIVPVTVGTVGAVNVGALVGSNAEKTVGLVATEKRIGRSDAAFAAVTLNVADLVRHATEGADMTLNLSPISGGKHIPLKLTQLHVAVPPAPQDYLVGSTDISLVMGLDFTATDAPTHIHTPAVHSEYANAIGTMTSLLLPLDSDACVPLYGFGSLSPGVYPSVFSLAPNGTVGPGECRGAEGIIHSYYSALANLPLVPAAAPAVAPFVQMVRERARETAGTSRYTIGVVFVGHRGIGDMTATLEALKSLRGLGASVIFVSVGGDGPGDVKPIEQFDARQNAASLTCGTTHAVHSREVLAIGHQRFAQLVLQELPTQLAAWSQSQRIVPWVPARPVGAPSFMPAPAPFQTQAQTPSFVLN